MNKEEAMKILKDFHDKSALFSVRTALDTIIPELEGSEDDRIKEELIKHLKDGSEGYMPAGGAEDYARWLSWLEKNGYTKKDVDDAYLKGICDTKHELEKQGDQKSVDKEYTFKSIPILLDMIEPTDRAKSYCKKLIDSLLKEGYTTDAKIVSDCLKQMNGEKVAMAVIDIEKQVEQPRYSIGDVLCDKSCTTLNKDTQHHFEIIDIRDGMYICDKGSFPISQQDEYELVAKKIEPKFQSGQWIVWQNKYYKVNYNGCGYELIDQNGLRTSLEYGTVDKSASIFTIQDAKDGDVLSNGKMIVIFKHFEDPSYRQHIVAYIGLDINSNIQITDDTWNLGVDKAKPATKEQRDTLLKAMADAGYTFDFGKKELKKIEKKSQRMVSAEAKEALYDKPTDEEMKELLRTEYEKGRADAIADMYVPTQISPEESLGVSSEKYMDIVDTLTQGGQKPAKWSLEDERVIAIINNALTESNTPPDDYDKVYDWLESLRKRIGG